MKKNLSFNRGLYILTAMILGVLFSMTGVAFAAGTLAWDKTFPKSDKVIHEKVSFHNRYGITIAADMYLPKNIDKSQKYAAIIVGTPYGGVKEQGAGIYAQTMAERGFVAIAFDESYNGESSGEPRRISSPETFVEDFSAAVDFIGTRPFVDRNKIGVIGICGSGGFSISAAQVDRRIKAIATISMYDMSRVKAKGWEDSMTEEARNKYLGQLGEQRWKEFEGGEVKMVGLPEKIDENTDPITREFYEYYKMPRGHHPNSTTEFTITSDMSFMNFPLMTYIKSISPRPILFIIGEHAHSRYFSEDAYEMAAEPKELYIVPGARHIDLYDRTDMIPFDKLTSFFTENLKMVGVLDKKTEGSENMSEQSINSIFPKGENGPADYFTGTTWVKMLVTDENNIYDTHAYDVRFEAKARTKWHSHPGGQLLFVTNGKGYYQEKGKQARLLLKGDVVEIPPDVVHWHGAAPDSRFVHLGMSTKTHLGPAKWFGAVTDEEYKEATSEQ